MPARYHLPNKPEFDPETYKDQKRIMWMRNVVDKYKEWPNEDIKADLIKKSLPCAMLVQNIEGDFNLANILRSCNNFAITDFYYYGAKRIDRRAAMGTYHYCNVRNIQSLDEIKALKDKYTFVGMENNVSNTIPLNEFSWPIEKPPCIVSGEEGCGIKPSLMQFIDHLVEIPSFGSVRSLNVGAAAAIVLWDYVSKCHLKKERQ